MKEFYTLESHSKAKKMQLFTPGGKKSKHFIMVLGRDSAPVRSAMADGKRSALENGAVDEAVCVLHAGMIESWSFDEKCTQENKIEFLKNAPSIADSIDSFSCNHGNFSKK